MNQSEFLNAREAAGRLGVKLDTLYAYVSRGLLRSTAVPGSRERHYRRDDVEAFRAARGSARAATEAVGAAAMPPIDSAICLIEGGRLFYRGQDAVRLSDAASLEDIAALLWGAEFEPGRPSRCQRPISAAAAWHDLDVIGRCQVRLAMTSTAREPTIGVSRATLAVTGQALLEEIVDSVIGPGGAAGLPAHRRLASQWRLDATGADLVRRCLVLLADHEFNASTFAARCVASTGASLAAVVSAALGALSGPRHGGAASRIEAIFRAQEDGHDPLMAIAGRLARGDELPGIGHPLYPEGDPRAVAILYALSLVFPQARRLVGYRPNIDLALAAVTTAFNLPAGAALGLFVVGRTVGWIAHAIEQIEAGVLLRPRARYTGLRHEA